MHSRNNRATGEMPIISHQMTAPECIIVAGSKTYRDRRICQNKSRENIEFHTKHSTQFLARGLARHSQRGGGQILL
jgi:hypothetical protein